MFRQAKNLDKFDDVFLNFRRFTGDLARKAKHVHAVDFMEAFITKNKQTNGVKHANTSFECADVLKLEVPKQRYIFRKD